MKKILKYLVAVLAFFGVLSAKAVYAFCPVCTIAVGGMLVLFERWGVDNTISGLWIGAFLLSFTMMTITWLNKKKYNFYGDKFLTFFLVYGSVIIPLYWHGDIGNPTKVLWGIDKVILGTAFGTLFFYLGYLLYPILKEKNGGHAWFPFQKVVMPIFPVALLTVLFYFITRR